MHIAQNSLLSISELKIRNLTSATMLVMTLAACSSDSDNPTSVVDDDLPDNTSDMLSVADAEVLLTNVVSVINEDAIDAFYQTANDDDLFTSKRFGITGDAAEQFSRVDAPTLETPYSIELNYGQGNFVTSEDTGAFVCDGGGGAIVHYNNTDVATDYVFDGCVINSSTYSGTAGTRVVVRGAVNRSPVYDLSILDSSGQTRTLSGGYSSGNTSFVVVDAQSNWNSAFYSGPVEGGELEISEYNVSRTNTNTENDIDRETLTLGDGTAVSLNEYTVSNSVVGTFSVSAPWSLDQSLAVAVDLQYSDAVAIATDVNTGNVVDYSGSDPEAAFHWQSGSVTVTAEDGSVLLVEPVENQPGSFLVTTSNGETLGPLALDIRP